ncbi:MAG: C40 family peptidase [Gammaproteobacteria bacterium]|nr:C40 family peptidase [Gammaproteobacteria bacterium]
MTRIITPLILTFLLISSCQQTQTIQYSRAEAASRVAKSMIGQSYRYGGQSPGGFDCSGLVWYSYKKVGVKTARTTKGLRKQAKKISRKELRAGDLVFFKGWIRTSHVGIYIGGGRFVHAPSSGKKIKIDRLDSGYWDDHFKSAGRILK